MNEGITREKKGGRRSGRWRRRNELNSKTRKARTAGTEGSEARIIEVMQVSNEQTIGDIGADKAGTVARGNLAGAENENVVV